MGLWRAFQTQSIALASNLKANYVPYLKTKKTWRIRIRNRLKYGRDVGIIRSGILKQL
jgi:ribosomal protein S30